MERFGKQVAGVVITHGHSDHKIGLARLQERFPHARGLATRDVLARARFGATDEGMRAYWRGLFPGEIPRSRCCRNCSTGTRSISTATSCA